MNKELAGLSLNPTTVARAITHHGLDVPCVDAGYRAAIEHGAAEIEVPMFDQRSILLASGADGIRRQRVTAAVSPWVGRAVTDAEDRGSELNLRLEPGGKVQKRLGMHRYGFGLTTFARKQWQLSPVLY